MPRTLFDLAAHEHTILNTEILALHQNIAAMDGRAFQIKGWSITIFSGAVALWVTKQVDLILFSAIFSTLLFWYMDALFKSFQQRFIQRLHDIERFLESGAESFFPGNSTKYFRRTHWTASKIQNLFSYAFYANVCTIYIAMIAFALFLICTESLWV
ncbi:MAG: hypothetical protein ACIAXF_13830 [Phycisphaerales bacterium JB063]